jgi:hypothetical protein
MIPVRTELSVSTPNRFTAGNGVLEAEPNADHGTKLHAEYPQTAIG